MAIHDLSHPLETGMPVYPGSDPVSIEPCATLEADGGRMRALDLDSHVGTHVDVPSHVIEDGAAIDDLAPAAFVFDALRVDCTHLDAREPIDRVDLPAHSDHDLLVFRTGWDEHWGTERYRDHPYLSPEAARWCAEHGCSVGLDTFSPDPTPTADPGREDQPEPTEFAAHEALLGDGYRILENLTNLGAPPMEFQLRALPLPIRNGDGSPVRAIAETSV